MDSRKPSGKSPASKPAGSKSRPAAKSPPKKAEPSSFMNWLGRQVGHVKKAVRTEATKPAAGSAGAKAGAKAGAGKGSSKSKPTPPPTAIEKVIYREDKIEEAELPDRPGVILRRTIIDEVVVETEIKPSTKE